MRILHFEDNGMKQSAINRVLKDCGIAEVVWVRNLEAGMELIESAVAAGKSFDLIITDMYFPIKRGENDDPDAGEQVIMRLKEKGLEIPVIVCSSVNYRVPGSYGCVWYSDISDWGRKLRELVKELDRVG